MKKQTVLTQQPIQEDVQPRPLMNSIVNPEGIVPEPISEVVKKEEAQKKAPPAPSQPEPLLKPVTKKTLPAKPPSPQQKQTQAVPAPSEDQLQLQKEPTPEDPKKEVFGSKQQMQNDLQYTSAMKKRKELTAKAAEKKVDDISARADNLLMKLKTVFPYDFFPNTVSIDSNKVTIIDKQFFASESVTSILLEEITDVEVNTNFFLAQMVITYSHHPLQPLKYKITHLRKKEALRAAEIIQGLLVLRISEGIDLSKLQPDEITAELSNIGKTHEQIPAL